MGLFGNRKVYVTEDSDATQRALQNMADVEVVNRVKAIANKQSNRRGSGGRSGRSRIPASPMMRAFADWVEEQGYRSEDLDSDTIDDLYDEFKNGL